MKIYRLDTVDWRDSQLLYHALARLGREGLILLSPASPYVCIGYFQDVEQEVDVEFCRQHDIPIFRREVGGGAVYLDGDQLFYQLIIHRDNPSAPASKEEFYRRFLQPPIEVYRALGIPAEYKPVNDIIAHGRKISGNGVAEIGEYVVLVGNLIVDFDYEMMTRMLRVPDEKFRDKVYKTLHDNLSTIRRELGQAPSREELWDRLAEKYSRLLGALDAETTVDAEWRARTDQLAEQFLTEAWLHRKRPPRADREVRIRAGVDVKQKVHKAPGGLLRATVEVQDGVIAAVSISGDFFFFPEEKLADLEVALVGTPVGGVEQAVADFYAEQAVESPGVTAADFEAVIG